jgi:hypothetical protein
MYALYLIVREPVMRVLDMRLELGKRVAVPVDVDIVKEAPSSAGRYERRGPVETLAGSLAGRDGRDGFLCKSIISQFSAIGRRDRLGLTDGERVDVLDVPVRSSDRRNLIVQIRLVERKYGVPPLLSRASLELADG